MLGTRQRWVRACGALAPATPVLGAPQARRSLSPRPFAQRAVAVVVEHKPRWTSRIAITERPQCAVTGTFPPRGTHTLECKRGSVRLGELRPF